MEKIGYVLLVMGLIMFASTLYLINRLVAYTVLSLMVCYIGYALATYKSGKTE